MHTRSQCESLAKEAGLYADKRGGWMTWEAPQKARVACLEALNAYTGTDAKRDTRISLCETTRL